MVLAHDYLTQPGGAERVVSVLARRWPEAQIRTLLYEPSATFSEFATHDVRTSWLQPLAGHVSHRALLPLFPFALRSLRVDQADIVISSSSGWAHGVPVASDIPHLCYCHNPARWLYDTSTYLDAVNPRTRAVISIGLSPLRAWDRRAARRPSAYVANSKNVQTRIWETYRRESVVVHPPVDVARFQPSPIPDDGYVLVLSRLLRYKRVDLAILAARRLGVPAVIAGEGPDARRLRSMAGESVQLLGRVADEDLPAIFAGARAFFLGGEEDFGITPLEANAAGRPVVAFGQGGALETVVDGVTGRLFAKQDEASATAAVSEVLSAPWDPQSLANHAARFAPDRFVTEIDEVVNDLLRA